MQYGFIRRDAQDELVAMREAETSEPEIKDAVKKVKSMKYYFRSTDPRCTAHWMRLYPWLALSMPFVITHKCALTHRLFYLAKSMLGHGLKLPAIAGLFAEMYDLNSDFTTAISAAHLYYRSAEQSTGATHNDSKDQLKITTFLHRANSSSAAPQRGSLRDSWASGTARSLPELPRRNDVPPTESYLRHVLMKELEAKQVRQYR